MGKSFDDYPPVMTTADVAEMLGHQVPLIRHMARTGRLPAHRDHTGRRWRFDRDELLGWLRSTRVTPDGK